MRWRACAATGRCWLKQRIVQPRACVYWVNSSSRQSAQQAFKARAGRCWRRQARAPRASAACVHGWPARLKRRPRRPCCPPSPPTARCLPLSCHSPHRRHPRIVMLTGGIAAACICAAARRHRRRSGGRRCVRQGSRAGTWAVLGVLGMLWPAPPPLPWQAGWQEQGCSRSAGGRARGPCCVMLHKLVHEGTAPPQGARDPLACDTGTYRRCARGTAS